MNPDTRYQITDRVLAQLPADNRPDRNQALLSWWRDFRSGQGLRLSTAGNQAFELAGVESWSFNLTNRFVIPVRNLLVLDRKLACPYFLRLGKSPQIVLYGSEAAMMLALYQDPEKWVAFLQQN